jgi:PE family
MSFVIAAPELVQGAAQDVAGIGSSLADVTASVAGPTTGVAAAAQDAVSVAIASLFGNFGAEFQALSAQAQAFHAQFVSAMNGSAAAYVSGEAAGQTLMSAAAAPAQALFGGGAAMVTGQAAPTVAQGIGSFGAAVAAPYQQLVINTNNNLAAINQTFMANPFPFANQVIINQAGFANTLASGVVTDLQGFPGNVPANIQLAIQGASTFNPGALLQGFVTQQQGYAFTVGSSLQLAGQDLITGVQTLPAGFQAAFQDLLAGNNIGAYGQIQQTLQNAFLPGFHDITVEVGGTTPVPVVPLGPLGDLAPIFAIPGQMAQNFTNLLPPGSIPAQMAQNFTNVLSAVTNFGTTINGSLDLTFGLPLAFVFDAIGAPAQALSALNSTGVALAGAVQAGNAPAAAAAILDAPAVVTNGFLNGQAMPIGANGLDINALIVLPPLTANLTIGGVPFGSLTTTAELPVGGLLTPLSPVFVGGGGAIPGTQIGGLIPGLLSFGPELAAAITPIG